MNEEVGRVPRARAPRTLPLAVGAQGDVEALAAGCNPRVLPPAVVADADGRGAVDDPRRFVRSLASHRDGRIPRREELAHATGRA